jgi:hypothetical protein
MEGTVWLDMEQKRLVRMSGVLTSDVKFGWGVLGHLAKGGTFVVEQREVGKGHWELTRLDVDMNGKALFFKTIEVKLPYGTSASNPSRLRSRCNKPPKSSNVTPSLLKVEIPPQDINAPARM